VATESAKRESGKNEEGAALFVLDPSGQRSRVNLDRFPFLIGRQPDNHLVLRDNRTSRSHARIVQEDDQLVLEDLNSRHGTWVNGHRIERYHLHNLDRIGFGVEESYQITVSLETGKITKMLEHFATSSHSGGMGDNALAKLRSLVEVARAVHNSLSTEEVLTAVVDAALSVTACERGFLLLRKGKELDITVARDREGKQIDASDLRVPRTLIQKALESRRELLSMSFDPLEEQNFRPEMSVAALELRSVVCLPLVQVRSGDHSETRITSTADATIGLLYMDSRMSPADLSAGNRELLQTLAMEASTILENSRLMEEERLKLKIESELNIAREIQQGLLPKKLPSEGWFRADGSSTPSRQVGGDYFDAHRVSPTVWTAVVADVCGKGVSSALLAGFLQGAFQMTSVHAGGLEVMMEHLNQFLLERTKGEKYATVFYCTLDASGNLEYANAGHCAPYLVSRGGRLRKLHTTGMPVGMLEEATFQPVTMQIEPGDKLVIYSDGLTEAANAKGEFYESERLRACLRENAARDAAGLHLALRESVDTFRGAVPARDDITVLVIEYAPS
jgi:sigma-B regulation protein RsbU (phosphoserine phosphatase)